MNLILIDLYLYIHRDIYIYTGDTYIFSGDLLSFVVVPFTPTLPPSFQDIPTRVHFITAFCHALLSDIFLSPFSLNTELCRFFPCLRIWGTFM